MPGVDGLELCRRLRAHPPTKSTYILLLTGKGGTDNIVNGLRSGANDYLTKPFDLDELSARLGVGRRVVELQQTLSERVAELEQALAHVKTLRGLIPICAWCKKIRNDQISGSRSRNMSASTVTCGSATAFAQNASRTGPANCRGTGQRRPSRKHKRRGRLLKNPSLTLPGRIVGD